MKLSDKIKEEIIELIELKYEGAYWDFKEDYSDNKADFLHDIICMANNLENKDAYLIYGVKDKTGEVVGIESSGKRKSQNEIINMLKGKKFGGAIRPEISLTTIHYCNHEIDVVIIKNTNNTPYFLAEEYQNNGRTLRAGSVYIRVGDTNTDIDKTADVDKVEYLWRKRFGIDLTPLEKLKFLLKNPKDWHPLGTDGRHSNSKYVGQYFHVKYPEFVIVYKPEENYFDNGRIDKLEHLIYWMQKLPMPLHNAYFYSIEVKYHTTALYSSFAVAADNYRFERTQWKHDTLFENHSDENILYCYVNKDSIEYLLDNWLCNHRETVEISEMMPFIDSLEPWSQQVEYRGFNPYSVVPVFYNEQERVEFISLVKNDRIKFLNCCGDYKWDGKNGTAKCNDIECIKYFCKTGEFLVEWLKDWRKAKQVVG